MPDNNWFTPMTEADVLREIREEGITAEILVRVPMPQVARRFHALDRSLRRLLADVQQYFPDAQYYTASGGFNLMLGRPHNDDSAGDLKAQQELVALSGLASIGDGDF